MTNRIFMSPQRKQKKKNSEAYISRGNQQPIENESLSCSKLI